MLERFWPRIPLGAYPLLLVHDPEGLLADERALAALAERGARVVREADPIVLRVAVEQARPWTVERPLLVASDEPLAALPYDLWQQGRHVPLQLAELFPLLAYPPLRALSPAQRDRLAGAPQPATPLGRGATADFLLRQVFGADAAALAQPAALVAWLAEHHAKRDVLPPELQARLLGRLARLPGYAGWPLAALLSDADTFAAFADTQWRLFVQRHAGQVIAESRAPYLLDFDRDPALQEALPALLRGGLAPPAVAEPQRLPRWARAGVLAEDEDARLRRVVVLLAQLRERFDAPEPPAEWRWPEWQAVARAWAELEALRHAPGPPLVAEQAAEQSALRERLDPAFLGWLRARYTPLAGQRLPAPSHVYHALELIAYERRQGLERIALLVLDGLSLADWQLVGGVWRARHPHWRLSERLLLAQVPTITAASRQALIAGLRPAEFAGTIGGTSAEPHLWRVRWEREGLPPAACAYVPLPLDQPTPPAALDDPRLRAVCLVHVGIDDLVHGASLGAADVQASLRLWLEQVSPRLEEIVDDLLGRDFTLYVGSDHGHVEARGTGQPTGEGLVVQTRGRRARVYRDRLAAERTAAALPGTVLWGVDGLLPPDFWAVLAPDRSAFAPSGDLLVTHGGVTLEEVVVPLATITRA